MSDQEKLVIRFLLGALVIGLATGLVRRTLFVRAIEGDVSAQAADSAVSALAAAASVSPGPLGRDAGEEEMVLVNVNTAGVEELQSLPGIGPVLANRILAHRESHGPFRSEESLLDVKGIGPKQMEKIRPWISL